MADKPEQKPSKRDEPVKIPLDPEVALRALLKVEPPHEDDARNKPAKAAKPKK
jgi:hypothetical protein